MVARRVDGTHEPVPRIPTVVTCALPIGSGQGPFWSGRREESRILGIVPRVEAPMQGTEEDPRQIMPSGARTVDARLKEQETAEAMILDHLPDIVTLCNRMFPRHGDAQDAVHEAVVAILRDLPTYRGEGPARHWLLKVALNAARSHRRGTGRRARRETSLGDQEVVDAMQPAPQDDREQREALRGAIAVLPESLREPLVLHYYHGLTQTEIGRCMGCSQKTVHVRIRKGLDHLQRRLAGTACLALLPADPGLGRAALDAVSPELVAAVEKSIVGHFAAAGTATAGTAGQAVLGNSLATTGVAAGGIVMQSKVLAGAALLAVTCLVGGALIADLLVAPGREREHLARVAALEIRVDADQAALDAAQRELSAARARAQARAEDLEGELARLRDRLAEQDRQIVALASGAQDREAAADTPDAVAEGLDREQKWERILEGLSGVLRVLAQMDEEGADPFQLGPQLVAELGRLRPEQFAELAAFDAEETDPGIVETIRSVMLQGLLFVPGTSPLREEYMTRYLERVRHAGQGEEADDHSLARISFSMPPFVDAYAKIVAPLGDELRRGFVDAALARIAAGNPVGVRLDGASLLARSTDPRATSELMRVVGQVAEPPGLRFVALQGLATRADEDVLRFLRDCVAAESDANMRAELSKAAAQVEGRVARRE